MAWSQTTRMAVTAYLLYLAFLAISSGIGLGAVNVILATPFLMVLPGFFLVSLLFPWASSKHQIDGFERVVYGIGASFAIVALSGILMQLTRIPFTAVTVWLWYVFLNTSLMAAALARNSAKRRAADSSVMRQSLRERAADMKPRLQSGKALYALTAVAMVITLGLVAVVTTLGVQPHEKFTEFYVLGQDGMADCYPVLYGEGLYVVEAPLDRTRCASPTVQKVILGFVNHEGRTMDYEVFVIWEEKTSGSNRTLVDTFTVRIQDASAEEFDFNSPHKKQHEIDYFLPDIAYTGPNFLVFELYDRTRTGGEEPIRVLELPLSAMTQEQVDEIRDLITGEGDQGSPPDDGAEETEPAEPSDAPEGSDEPGSTDEPEPSEGPEEP